MEYPEEWSISVMCNMRDFVCVDDTSKNKITSCIEDNELAPNIDKTQIRAFHFCNMNAK